MKTYKQLLSESKDRFFRKNSTLTSEQEEELIDAVKKYKRFEQLIDAEIGWNKVSRTSYYKLKEILNRAMDSKSSEAENVEFDGDVFSSDYMFEGLYSGVNFDDESYDAYFEFAQAYLGFEDERNDLYTHLYDIESEVTYGSQDPDGAQILAEMDLPHPEEAESDD